MKSPSDDIFHLNGDQLIPMPSRSMREGLLGKSLEDALQTFLERYPQIIPGKQLDPGSEDPPRCVLLRREMPVGGWSLDHLYVDQRGILTLVETKLFQNPESRREVIGQIIEYAANASESWAGGMARQKATEFWSSQNPPQELDELLQHEFGGDIEFDTNEFWRKVEENLKNNRIRLIIATDELRPEVRRMIEYLNKWTQNAEVLGLELKCYGAGSESLVLVPRLIGQTQSVIDEKVTGSKYIKWTVSELKSAFSDLSNTILRERLEKILYWAVANSLFKESLTENPIFKIVGKKRKPILSIYGSGGIYLFTNIDYYLGGAAERNETVDKLKDIDLLSIDYNIESSKEGKGLTRKISDLSEQEFEKFFEIIKNICGQS